MKTYTTCPTCDDLLLVADPDLPVHPTCEQPYQLKLEQEFKAALAAGDDVRIDSLWPILDAPRVTSLAKSAALYASWGWAVFPLKAGQKVPDTRHGVKEATTEISTVAAWWARNPHYNIGLACGGAFDVIDVDTPKSPGDPSGYVTLADLDEAGALPDVHGIALTGRGGKHLYVLAVQGATNRAGMAPCIDYRASGGYVVAPPSIVDGRKYAWSQHPSPAIKVPTRGSYGWLGESASDAA